MICSNTEVIDHFAGKLRITPCSHSAPRLRLRCSATRSARETFRFASFIRSPGRARILEYKKRARRVGTSGKLLAALATSATHIRYPQWAAGREDIPQLESSVYSPIPLNHVFARAIHILHGTRVVRLRNSRPDRHRENRD